MIAYNHYIKFIPELDTGKTVKASFDNIVTIKELKLLNSNERLEYSYKWTWSNNQGRDIFLYTDREFNRTVPGQAWEFNIKNVVTFLWHSGDLTLKYIPEKNFTLKLLEYWSLHIVLPIFFTIEEQYDFLHAGAVEVDGEPILFLAESFGGKSTMTDFFIKQGHTMISDDKVAVIERDGEFLAVPSHPHHRPYRKTEDLGYFIENISTKPKPLQAVYELEPTEAGADINITELVGIEKFESLRFSSEINLSFLKVQRFELISCLAKQVPVYKVFVPWDLNRLIEVYHAIVKHSKNIS